MTFVSHAYMGAVAYAVIAHAVGIEPGIAAPIAGAILGSAPDTLDWIGAELLGLFPRWWLYVILHHPSWPLLILESALIAPGLHIMFDKLIHAPVLPREGESADYDVVLFKLFGANIRRRDIHWITGEALVVAIATMAWIAM